MLYFCVLFTRFARYGRSTLRPYWYSTFYFYLFVFFADAARCVPTGYSMLYFCLFCFFADAARCVRIGVQRVLFVLFFYGRSTLRPYWWCVLLKQSYCHCKILFSIYSDMLLKSLRLRIAWS